MVHLSFYPKGDRIDANDDEYDVLSGVDNVVAFDVQMTEDDRYLIAFRFAGASEAKKVVCNEFKATAKNYAALNRDYKSPEK